MRKMLLVSTVLFVAAQAFAANVTMSVTKKAGTGSDRWASIGYSADANVSAFGLKIYTADPNKVAKITAISDYNVGESNSVKRGYGIFPGTIDVCDTNGTVLSWGTPIAPSWDPCTEGTGLDTNTIIVEMGALYEEGNKPPLNGTLISVKVDGDCNVCVTGEPLRGNVVVYESNGCVASVSPATVCTRIALPIVYYDFGDACDTYLTLQLSGGPYHTMTGPNTGSPILGVNIDAELNGQPSTNCLLDDTTGVPDDEDGITNLTAVYNQGGTVTVTVSAVCKLDAWIDWNNNGVWNLPGEQVFANLPLNNISPAVNNLTFAVPAGATRGVALVSRWRVSTAGSLPPGGLAENGEVEDYRGPTVLCHVPYVVGDLNSVASAKLDANGFTNIVTVKEYNDVVAKDYVIKVTPGWCNTIACADSVTMTVSLGRQPLDYGDLPDTYKTVWASNGARHVPTGVTLGSTRDTEADGQPSANARGDDTNGIDDENGVQFWGGRIVRITVSQACKLNAWVDFDANGSFNDSNERIFNNTVLAAGSKSLLFAVPTGFAAYDTYLKSRWRVDANGGLSFTGQAPDGEVEDYNKPFISNCYEPCDPCYTDWDTVGRPYCWCYLRQCHGDADGAASTTKSPFYWVTNADLTILRSAWLKTVDLLASTDICADFDRRASTTKSPFYRVTNADLTILRQNWLISGKPDPNCNPGTKTPATAPTME